MGGALFRFQVDPARDYVLTASFRAFPARNFGTRDAGIWIGSPVLGLRPLDALRCETWKLPNPTIRTSSPDRSADAILAKVASTASAAASLVMFACLATWAIKSVLFTGLSFPLLPFNRRLLHSRIPSECVLMANHLPATEYNSKNRRKPAKRRLGKFVPLHG